MAASEDDKMEAEFEALALAISVERRRELAVEHLLFQTVAYVERQNPGLLDHLEESVAHLGDSAEDETKDDEAVRDIARLFIRSLRKKTD